MNSAWKEYVPPSYVPSDYVVPYGSDPCWSPAREGLAIAEAPDGSRVATGLDGDPSYAGQPKDTCGHCGGRLRVEAQREAAREAREAGNVDPLAPFAPPPRVFDPVRGSTIAVTPHGEVHASGCVAVCPACNYSSHDRSPAMERAVKPRDGEIRDDVDDLKPGAPKPGHPATPDGRPMAISPSGIPYDPQLEGVDHMRRTAGAGGRGMQSPGTPRRPGGKGGAKGGPGGRNRRGSRRRAS